MLHQVISKKKLREKNVFFVGIFKATEDQDPESQSSGMDPRIRIRIERSRIRYTGYR